MKILHLSDLHREEQDKYGIEEQNRWIRSLLTPDITIAVITGDVFESSNYKYNREFNPYKRLGKIFEDTPVLCTLGNHEFYFLTPAETRDYYKSLYKPNKYNVHYLDVIGFYDLGKYRFLGNCFWYDGSMQTVKNQKMETFVDGRWMDKYIKDFDWVKENSLCKNQIIMNKSHDKKNILCTHTVPHKMLNRHMDMDATCNEYNAYSGVMTYLDDNKFDYSLSGHTHRRVAMEINGCQCYNPGNDICPPFSYYVIELED